MSVLAKKGFMKLALDNVEPWTPEQISEFKAHKKVRLQDGLTNKMLYKDVIRIAWPSMIELLLTQLASMVDLMMVGKLGVNAITSVSLTTQPKFLLMTLVQSLGVGTTAMVARYKGAGSPEKANKVMRQSLMMVLFVGILMSLIGYIFATPMIKFMGGDEETLADAVAYLRIQMIGFTPFALTVVITAALRGAGDSKSAMVYNVTSNAVTVLFNYMLIYGHFGMPRMEVAGASLATIIGQTVAFVIAVVVVMKKSDKKYLLLRLRDGFKPDKIIIGQVFSIGIPSMIENLIMRVGMVIFAKLVVSLGNLAFATHQVCMNIQALSFMLGQAIAVSSTSLVGQSLGKRRPDMARHYSIRSASIGTLCALVLAAVFAFFGKYIVKAYNDDATVMELGAKIMLIVAALQPFQCTQFVLAGSLRGAGDTRATAVITTITVVFVRAGLGYVFIKVLDLGLFGAWYAMAADQLMRTLLVSIRYLKGKWMFLKIKNA